MKRIVTLVLTVGLFSTSAGAEDKLFWALSTGAQAATIYDIETSLRVFDRCTTCYEANPIMRPFIGSRSTAYTTGLGLSSLGSFGSYKLKEKGVRWWWLPLVGQIGMHTVLGIRNSRMR